MVKIKLKKFKDPNNKNSIDKGMLFNLPSRILIAGSSGSGKTQILLSLLLSDDAYKKDFKGANMYIFAPTICNKLEFLIQKKKIPEMNLFIGDVDEEILSEVYEKLIDDYKHSVTMKEKPEHTCLIFDDLGFSSKMASRKKNDIFSKIACNSRKWLVTTFSLVQDYYQVNKTIRNNCTGLILFNMNNRSLEAIESENNFMENKKEFKNLIRANLRERHDHIIINYTNTHKKGIYLDQEFEAL